MTSQEIVNTEWALQLWENTTPEYFYEIVDRMVAKKPVFIAWMGDSAEITLGSYTIHSTATMDEAITWCQQFELPVHTQQPDIVPELQAWLKHRASDAKLPVVEQAAYINVLNKIEQLKGQQ